MRRRCRAAACAERHQREAAGQLLEATAVTNLSNPSARAARMILAMVVGPVNCVRFREGCARSGEPSTAKAIAPLSPGSIRPSGTTLGERARIAASGTVDRAATDRHPSHTAAHRDPLRVEHYTQVHQVEGECGQALLHQFAGLGISQLRLRSQRTGRFSTVSSSTTCGAGLRADGP